jgi:hypothetical protein
MIPADGHQMGYVYSQFDPSWVALKNNGTHFVWDDGTVQANHQVSMTTEDHLVGWCPAEPTRDGDCVNIWCEFGNYARAGMNDINCADTFPCACQLSDGNFHIPNSVS